MNKAIILGVFSLWIQRVNSINASPHPHTYTQPDGTAITVVGHGDESSHWESDLQAFTILEDDKGYIVYAEETAEGKLIPSSERVGKPHPKTMKKDLQDHGPHDCSREVCGGLEAQIMAHEKMPLDDLGERRRRLLENDPGPKVHGRRAVATTGTLKNLVVLLRFNDHHSRNLPSVADIEVLMNSNDPHPILAPTGSLKGVFLENSYGQLSIESTVMPWLLMPRTEAYYADGVSGSTNLHEALRFALNYLDNNNVINFNDFDEDNDGYIDAITFLHSGYGAEWMGTDCHGQQYAKRIWSHKWSIWSDSSGSYRGPWVSNNGNVRVWNYHISPSLWGLCGSDIGHIGVIAHETAHFLGLPDLYDTNGGGIGLGAFDMMAYSWGFDGTQYYPGHMSAWCKLQMRWIDPVTPSLVGENSVANAEEVTSEVQYYKIGDGQFGFPPNEYLLIENRQPKGMDAKLPHGGLAIYQVDDSLGDNFSTEGYPGQSGWPGNGKHYRVALLQADGLYSLEKRHNIGGNADLFRADNVGYLGPTGTTTNSYPNTNSYKGGNIKTTNVEVYNIGYSGDTMTFGFTDGTPITDMPSPSPSPAPTYLPSSRPSLSPSTIQSHSPSLSNESSKKLSSMPSLHSSLSPSLAESDAPFTKHARVPSSWPSLHPSIFHSITKSHSPSPSKEQWAKPSQIPPEHPSLNPSIAPSMIGSHEPSLSKSPTASPSQVPTPRPSLGPSMYPSMTGSHSSSRSKEPSTKPSRLPLLGPSSIPSMTLSMLGSHLPSLSPTPSLKPSQNSSPRPSMLPDAPSMLPSMTGSHMPSFSETSSSEPTQIPSKQPSLRFSVAPSVLGSKAPSFSKAPSKEPSQIPSSLPTLHPSLLPSVTGSHMPTLSIAPSSELSRIPSSQPSFRPSLTPSVLGSKAPSLSKAPSIKPSPVASSGPSLRPSMIPSITKSHAPSRSRKPSAEPSQISSPQPSASPSIAPFMTGSHEPSFFKGPTTNPSHFPTPAPSLGPSMFPSMNESHATIPSKKFLLQPSRLPSSEPSSIPPLAPSMIETHGPTQLLEPAVMPSLPPSSVPSLRPSTAPSATESKQPSVSRGPSDAPSLRPSQKHASAIPSAPLFGTFDIFAHTPKPSTFPSTLPINSPAKQSINPRRRRKRRRRKYWKLRIHRQL